MVFYDGVYTDKMTLNMEAIGPPIGKRDVKLLISSATYSNDKAFKDPCLVTLISLGWELRHRYKTSVHNHSLTGFYL